MAGQFKDALAKQQDTEVEIPKYQFINLANKFIESEGIMKPALFKLITEQQKKYTDSLHRQLSQWNEYMNFMYLYNLDYAYRAQTEAIFANRVSTYFDFFFVNDDIFS